MLGTLRLKSKPLLSAHVGTTHVRAEVGGPATTAALEGVIDDRCRPPDDLAESGVGLHLLRGAQDPIVVS